MNYTIWYHKTRPMKIESRLGVIEQKKYGNSLKAELTLYPQARQRFVTTFNKMQATLDSEILRRADKYVAFQTGMLKKSGIIGTVIGTGIIRYIAPYAHERHGYIAHAGRIRDGKWIERMIQREGKELERNMQRKFGGGK